MADDSELLRQYAEQGSQEAFAELVRRRIDLVYSVALRRMGGDAHEAEDVVQIVFRDLARKAPTLLSHPALTGWLFTSTRYAAVQLTRSKQRRQIRELEASTMNDSSNGLPAEPEWDRLRPVIDSILDQLNERDRLAIVGRFYENRSFAEIGRLLASSDDGARMRVQRALDKLRVQLEKHGLRSTPAALAVLLSTHAVTAAPVGLAAQVASATAMATSAAATAVATPLFSFMSTAKVTGILAGAALLVGLGFTGSEYHASRKAADSLEQARASHAAMLDQVRFLEQRAQARERDRLRLEKQLAVMNAASGPLTGNAATAAQKREGDGTGPASQPELNPNAAGRAFLDAHPDVEEALIARSRARALSRYGALFAQLGLSPDQIHRFEDIIMQGEGFGGENGLLFQVGPTHASGGEIRTQLQSLLGGAGFQQYQQYMRAMGQIQGVGDLAGNLYSTDSPLSAAQADQLKQAYATSAATGLRGQGLHDAFMTKAQQVLNPVQFTALQNMLQQNQLNGAVMQAAKEAQAAVAGGKGSR